MIESVKKAKVLVIDDQPANIQILAEALQDQYDVRIANNGEKGLLIAQQHDKPDLILLDIMMPDLDGYEVCRRLKSNPLTMHIPVIFVTARNNVLDEEHGLNIGAIDYISKPFNIPTVRARVNNHIVLKQHADLLEELALIDPLTHLANRRQFEHTLQTEWKRCQREQLSLSVLFADIDFFKNYNDHYGHGAGDRCLQQVAKVLAAKQTRPGDLIARFGGEEFIAIFPNTDLAGAKIIGESLRKSIENAQIPHACSSVAPVITISVGCATAFPANDQQDTETLVHHADIQLYEAKNSGRNSVAG